MSTPSSDPLTLAVNLSRHWASYYASQTNSLRSEWEDMVQEGIVAALLVIPKYNPEQGAHLITFLQPRIRGAIVDYLRRRDPLTRNHRNAIRKGAATDPGRALSVETDLFQDPALYTSMLDEVDDQDAIRRALHEVAARHPEYLGLIVDWLKDDGTPQKKIGERYGFSESRTSQIIRNWLREIEHNQEAP